MAINFLKETPAWNRIRKPSKARIEEIFATMDDDFTLKKGQITAIAEKLHTPGRSLSSMKQMVSNDTSFIRNIIRLLKREEGIVNKLKADLNRGSSRSVPAKRIFNVWKEIDSMTWEDIETMQAELSDSAVAVVEDDNNVELQSVSSVETFDDANTSLEKLDVGLRMVRDAFVSTGEENKSLKKAIREQDRKITRLVGLIGNLNKDAANILEDTGTHDDEDVFADVYGLPQRANAFVGNPEVVYEKDFIKTFKSLDVQVQRQSIKQIHALCAEGRQRTIGSQQHEKLASERRGVIAPQGSYIGRVSKQYRYLWQLEQNGGSPVLHIFSICKHDVLWDSEK